MKKIAILVANGFEQVELTEPRKALDGAGFSTALISPEKDRVQGWHHDTKTDFFAVDVQLENAQPHDYDALLLPGGVFNPDELRLNPQAISFIKHFVQAKKPIAAICHGPWTLINALGVAGKTMTSWPSLSLDLQNAGAHWQDKAVVVDGNLITSRKPEDIAQFNKAFIELLSENIS